MNPLLEKAWDKWARDKIFVKENKMKVRVLKEMPFAKVGEVHQIDIKKMCCFNFNWYTVEDLINDGWLEEVNEESLEDKISYYLINIQEDDLDKESADIAQIAISHFKEHPEEILKDWDKYCDVCGYYININDLVSIDEILERYLKIRARYCKKVETDIEVQTMMNDLRQALEGLRK